MRWYEPKTKKYLGERLIDVTEEEVRRVLQVRGSDPVRKKITTDAQRDWLDSFFMELIVPIHSFDYYVEEKKD